ILSFKECTVSRNGRILFAPEWGEYDMACGQTVVSVFGGAADRPRYLAVTQPYRPVGTRQKSNLTEENRPLVSLYEKVRNLRESQTFRERASELTAIYEGLKKRYPEEW